MTFLISLLNDPQQSRHFARVSPEPSNHLLGPNSFHVHGHLNVHARQFSNKVAKHVWKSQQLNMITAFTSLTSPFAPSERRSCYACRGLLLESGEDATTLDTNLTLGKGGERGMVINDVLHKPDPAAKGLGGGDVESTS